MIKNIVFDIGNVLAPFSWQKTYKKLFGDGELYDKIANATVLSEDKWAEIDRGVLTYDEVLESFIKNEPDLSAEIKLAVNTIFDDISQYEYSEDWVLRLKAKGYKVYLLSNFGDKPYNTCLPRFAFSKHVDGGIISYEVRRIKPNNDIFEALCGKYSIKAQESVFIDDSQKNVDAAKALGFNGIVFDEKINVDKKLNDLGVFW